MSHARMGWGLGCLWAWALIGCPSESGTGPMSGSITMQPQGGTGGAHAGAGGGVSGSGGAAGVSGIGGSGGAIATGTGGEAGSSGAAGTAGTEPPPPAEGCDDTTQLAGTYALEVTLPISWPQSGTYLMAGQGTIRQTMLVKQVTNGDGTVTATARTCSMYIPPFMAGLPFAPNTLQPSYPDATFDAPGMLESTLTISLDGSALSSATGAAVFGLDLADPINDPFPATNEEAPAADHDGDGKPGVTAVKGPEALQGFIVDGSGVGAEAQKMYLAVRTLFTLNGQLTNCDRADGTIALAGDGLKTLVLGCADKQGLLGAAAGGECTPTETDFLQGESPHYESPQGGTWKQLRVAADATCTDVRAFDFAQ